MNEVRIGNPGSTVVLTKEQAESIGIGLDADNHGLEILTKGPWSILQKCKGICVTKEYAKTDWGRAETTSITFYGSRSLSNVSQKSYHLDGYVSIKGKKYSAYTSEVLIEVEGKLINVEVFCARMHPYPY